MLDLATWPSQIGSVFGWGLIASLRIRLADNNILFSLTGSKLADTPVYWAGALEWAVRFRSV